MKILHTSDWHLGQNFFEYDRSDDHRSMVEQLAKLIKDEEPDALIIAGDVYDISTPNTTVQREFAEYMVKLHDAFPQMAIVCISGNHDSASRHEIYQTPWEALNVYMVGKPDFENLENNIIRIGDKGWVVSVPYTNERYLTDDFYSRLEQTAKEVTGETLPIVYVGHAAIKDSDFTGHKCQDNRFIGGIECTSIDELGKVYDYLALGHIHKAQTFGSNRARYCGSPLPVSFDEVKAGYEHGFTIVEIEAHNNAPEIRTVEVECPRPLVNIPSDGYAEWADAIDELKRFPSDIEAFIRLNILLKGNDLLPYDKETQISNALIGKKARHANINPTRELVEAKEGNTVTSMTLQELQKTDPKEILKLFAEAEGKVFDAEFEEMFDIVYRTVNNPDYED